MTASHPNPTLPESLPTRTTVLPNGARLMVCDLPHLHRTALMVGFTVGSRDEPPTVHGVTHLLEHLMFRGCRAYPSLKALSSAFEDIGGNLNGYTTRESTGYDTLLPPDSLATGIDLLAQFVLTPKLTGIRAERDIVIEEILDDYDEHGRLVAGDDLLMEFLYGDKGLGRTIAGHPETLRHVTKEHVRGCYRQWYSAPQAVIVVAGKVASNGDIESHISEAFAGLPPDSGSVRSLEHPSPNPEPGVWFRKHEGATQTEICLGIEGPMLTHATFPSLEVAVRLLDDGLSSRLPRRLIDELGLVYDVEAYLAPFRDRTVLQIRAACRHRRVPRVVRELLDAVGTLASEGPTDDELNRVKRRILWEHQALLDRPASVAHWLTNAAQSKIVADPRKRCEALNAVTRDDVCRVLSAHFLKPAGQRLMLVGELGRRSVELSGEALGNITSSSVAVRSD